MKPDLYALHRRLDRWAWPLGLLGVAAVAAANWYLWQRDKEMLSENADPPPLMPLQEWPDLPLVSVLVAAWNEVEHVERHIESFLALRYPHRELVICAGGQDGTYESASKFASPQIQVLRQHADEGKQNALRRGLPESRGEIIVLTDADCVFDTCGFERIIYPLVAGREVVTTGTSRPLQRQMGSAFVRNQWAPHRYHELRSRTRYRRGILGRNCAVLRGLLEEAWADKEKVATGTDYYLALRLRACGYRIFHVAGSTVQSHYPETLDAYVRQQTRWLRNLIVWGCHFRDWYHVRWGLISAGLGAIMLLWPLAALFAGSIVLVGWLLLLTHVLLSRMRRLKSVGLGQGDSGRGLSGGLVTVMLGDFFAWGRVWIDICHRERREQW